MSKTEQQLAQEKAQQIAEQNSAQMHKNDRCAHTLAMTVEAISPGKATVSMPITEDYVNGHGFCQGGIITTLADTAFAHACNSYGDVTVAQGLSIDFVRSCKLGDVLTAKARELSRGRLTGVYHVKVTNTAGQIVALMTGKSFTRC